MSGLTIARYDSLQDVKPKALTTTFDGLVGRLKIPRHTECTVATCSGKDCPHKRVKLWSPGAIADGKTRADDNVDTIGVAVFDHDHLTNDEVRQIEHNLVGVRSVIHPTHSDRDGDRAVRSVVALSRPVTREEHRRVWRLIVDNYKLDPVDSSKINESAMYFWPTRPADGEYNLIENAGPPVDVDALLAADKPEVKTTERAKVIPLRTDAFDIDAFMSTHCPGARQRERKGKRVWFVECPWSGTHSGKSDSPTTTTVSCDPSGALGFNCKHDHCTDRHWRDFRKHHDPSWVPFDERPVVESKFRTDDDVGNLPANENTANAPRWRFIDATPEWLTDALPPREHLLDDVRTGRGAMDRHGVWLFGGSGGAGKSYATLDLAVAVVSGGAWLDTFSVRASGRVLIIAAEDEVDDIRRRVHAIGVARGVDPSCITRLTILPIASRVTSLVARVGDVFSASADTLSLCTELESREPYDLAVVDPYGRIAGVSVDADNAAAAATISALNLIARAARGLVLGITHTSLRSRIAARNGASEGATAIRGATGQADYARGVIRLEQEADAIYLSLGKANHVAPWERVALRRGERGELIRVDPSELPKPVDRAQAKEDRRRERDRLDDAAARTAIGEHPGESHRTLRSIVMGVRACGKDRADSALARVRFAAAEGDP